MANTTNCIYTIADILKSTDYALEVFESEEIEAIELFDKKSKPYLKDFVDGKDRPAKPEEIVRQLYLYRLIHTYGYPVDRISVEKAVYFGSTVAKKKADIVICDRDDPDTAYIIIDTAAGSCGCIVDYLDTPGKRFDPEYYQPKYLELANCLSKIETSFIEDFASKFIEIS